MNKPKPKRVYKKKKETTETFEEKNIIQTVVTKEDWCCFVADLKTEEVFLYGSHLKKVIQNLIKKLNHSVNFKAKGPYRFYRNSTYAPSFEEFNNLK